MTEPIPEPEDTTRDTPLPTQVVYWWQAVARTLAAVVCGQLFALLLSRVPELVPVLTPEIQRQTQEVVYYAIAVAGPGFITWLMTRPQVNGWLTKIGLGARPKHAGLP